MSSARLGLDVSAEVQATRVRRWRPVRLTIQVVSVCVKARYAQTTKSVLQTVANAAIRVLAALLPKRANLLEDLLSAAAELSRLVRLQKLVILPRLETFVLVAAQLRVL